MISRTMDTGRGYDEKDIFDHLNFFSFLYSNNSVVFSFPVALINSQNVKTVAPSDMEISLGAPAN
jgi:hypothetical protein